MRNEICLFVNSVILEKVKHCVIDDMVLDSPVARFRAARTGFVRESKSKFYSVVGVTYIEN